MSWDTFGPTASTIQKTPQFFRLKNPSPRDFKPESRRFDQLPPLRNAVTSQWSIRLLQSLDALNFPGNAKPESPGDCLR